MSGQFEMNFGKPQQPEVPPVPQENADIDLMTKAELKKLIDTLDPQISAAKRSEPAWANELQERRDLAQRRIEEMK